MNLRTSTLFAGLVLTASTGFAQLSAHTEDFEGLTVGDAGALSGAGFLVFANVFDSGGNYLGGYGPFAAPNHAGGFCGLDPAGASAALPTQAIVTYSDYNNGGDMGAGHTIETNVFLEQIVDASDVGKTFEFTFDSALANLGGGTTASGFIKIIDSTVFSLDGFDSVDTTPFAGPESHTLSITIDANHVGDFFQIGFQTNTCCWEDSGVHYDNLVFGEVGGDPCAGDDALEENDDCLSATPLGAGTYTGLKVKKTDEDFYRVTVPDGVNITAVITFDPAVDTDLQLIADDCSTVLDSSASVSGSETVTFANASGASVDVNIRAHVWSGASGDCNDYDLDITLAGDPCQTTPDDGFEDNDSCAAPAAGPLGHIPGLFVSKTDPDYYSYHIPDGHTFDGTIQFIHADGDCDIFLWEVSQCDTGAGGALAFAWSTDDNEVLSWTNNTGAGVDAIFHVQVWSGSAQDCNSYDMINAITAPAPWNNYCGPAAVNSTGASATIWAAGTAEIIHGNFHLHAGGMPAGENMMFLSSMTQGSTAVGSGTLCLGGSIGRFRTSLQTVNGGGGAQHHVDLNHVPNGPGGQPAMAGETWNFQGWFRDGASSNFTDGLEVTFL